MYITARASDDGAASGYTIRATYQAVDAPAEIPTPNTDVDGENNTDTSADVLDEFGTTTIIEGVSEVVYEEGDDDDDDDDDDDG